jgi:RAB protein geranylgeranyltransferase component A
MEPNNEVVLSYHEKPFVELMRSQGLSDVLQKFLIYSIVLLETHEQENSLTTREALERLLHFSSSLGRYGATPFLYPLYGTSELAQAFCRYVPLLFLFFFN